MFGYGLLGALVTWATVKTVSGEIARPDPYGPLQHNEDPTMRIVATCALVGVILLFCVAGAVLTYREAARRQSTVFVFPGLPLNLFSEIFFVVVGALLAFVPSYLLASAPFMRPQDLIQLIFLGPLLGLPGLALMMMRPIYRLDPGARTLSRYRVASWIPWRKPLPYHFTVEARRWTSLRGAGQSAVAVAWAIYGRLPEDKEFVVELLDLNTHEAELEARRTAWQRTFGV
jgi:hypothetical protein